MLRDKFADSAKLRNPWEGRGRAVRFWVGQGGGVVRVWGELYPEFFEAESDGHPFSGLQLLEVLLPNAHLSHHGFGGAVCGDRNRRNPGPWVLAPPAQLCSPSQAMSSSLTCFLLLVAAQDDPATAANAQCHFSQCKGKGQNSLPENPVRRAEHYTQGLALPSACSQRT